MSLTEAEKRFIMAYRQADDRAKHDAKKILEWGKRPEGNIISVGQILALASALGKSVDELLN